MKNNDLIKTKDDIFRILDIQAAEVLVVNCRKKSVPKWVARDAILPYSLCTEDDFPSLPDINDLDACRRKCAYERFSWIAGVLPFITDKNKRCAAIQKISEEKGVSSQTIQQYLWLYLVHQNIASLAPVSKANTKELTADECALQLRTKYLASEMCEGSVVVTADYGERVYGFTLDLEFNENKNPNKDKSINLDKY